VDWVAGTLSSATGEPGEAAGELSSDISAVFGHD